MQVLGSKVVNELGQDVKPRLKWSEINVMKNVMGCNHGRSKVKAIKPLLAALHEQVQGIGKVMLMQKGGIGCMRYVNGIMKDQANLSDAKTVKLLEDRQVEPSVEQTISQTGENALPPQSESTSACELVVSKEPFR